MKKIILTIAVSLSFMSAFADGPFFVEPGSERGAKRVKGWAPFYLGLSGGINNPAGFLGLDLNMPVSKHVLLGAGAGFSTWGDKLHVDAKYFIHSTTPSWAFGGGFTYALGEKNFKTTMDTEDGSGYDRSEEVTVNQKAQSNLFVAAYRYWNLGRQKNKCYLEMGYSIPLNTVSYEQVNGDPMTSTSDAAMKLLAPGGIILGFGFSFGLGDKN